MLTLLALLSMAVALAAFFAVMLWLDPKRRQYVAVAAATVAVGAAGGLADVVPTVGGVAWAQSDSTEPPADEPPVWAIPQNCGLTAGPAGTGVTCDGIPFYTLDEFCNQFGSMFAESFCYGAISGGSSGGGGGSGGGGSGGSGSGGGSSGGSGDSGINTIPLCRVSGNPLSPSEPLGLPITCRSVPVELVVFQIGMACHAAAIAAGAVCTLLSRGGVSCSLSVGAGASLSGYVGACDSLVEVSRTFLSH